MTEIMVMRFYTQAKGVDLKAQLFKHLINLSPKVILTFQKTNLPVIQFVSLEVQNLETQILLQRMVCIDMMDYTTWRIIGRILAKTDIVFGDTN